MRATRRPASVSLAQGLGILTLCSLVPLLGWDVWPRAFPARAHDTLGAIPLALVAVAWLVHHMARQACRTEWARALLVAAAFIFWAANQFWPDHPLATAFNDVAIALFVADLFLSIISQPPSAPSTIA